MKIGKLLLIVTGASGFAMSSCGYLLQTSDSPIARRDGIYRIYVAPVQNNTYKPGVENMVYNALLKEIAAHDQFKLVGRPEESDAVLNGGVDGAERYVSGETDARSLNPVGRGSNSSILVASSYTAALSCWFNLSRQKTAPGKPLVLWSSVFEQSKPFLGNNQRGALGTTSALINESEFDRALRDLAQGMMSDVYESMIDRF